MSDLSTRALCRAEMFGHLLCLQFGFFSPQCFLFRAAEHRASLLACSLLVFKPWDKSQESREWADQELFIISIPVLMGNCHSSRKVGWQERSPSL